MIAHLCNNFGFYILLLWLPSYLHHTFNVPMERLGLFSVIPYIAAFIMQVMSGFIADALHKRGMRMSAVRKSIQTVAFTLGALPLLALPAAHSAEAAVTLVAISLGGTSLNPGGFAVNHLDVAPRYAGVLMGITNTVAPIPGIIGVAATGFILQATGSFAAAFYLTALIYVVGLICYAALGSGDRKI